MKVVSVQELKRRMSSVLHDAAENGPVLVTRHGKPLVRISAAGMDHVIAGSRHGRGSLRPELSRGSKGRYLEALLDDRRDGPDR